MRFVQAAAFAAIVTLLSVAVVTAKPIATTGETNLRKSPGTDSEVLTLVPKGSTVEVSKCTNGWCAATFDGKDGFVIARNVGMGPRPAPRGRFRMRPGEIVDEAPVYYGRPYPYYYRPYPYGYYRPWGYGWGWRW